MTIMIRPSFEAGRPPKATDLPPRSTTARATDWHDGQISKLLSSFSCRQKLRGCKFLREIRHTLNHGK
jgi:hypothetical protein